MTEQTAQQKANTRWKQKNKEKNIFYTVKSSCKRYIKEFAGAKELEEVKDWIEEKEKEIKK